jgi:hypothetical protein
MTVATATNEVQATVNNPAAFGTAITITGTITDASTLTFTGQTVGTGVSLSGTMTLNSTSTLTFNYTVTDATGTQTCNGNYTKL